MLVIRRRAGQSLLVGDDIEIEVLEVGLNKVKLGISGSRSIHVMRKEVQLAAENNRHAGSLTAEAKDLIVERISGIAQTAADGADKHSRSRYSGYPTDRRIRT